MSLLHLLNLDTIGGVEELFINFLETARSHSKLEQHVLVTGKKPHPFFQKRLQIASSVTLEKYLYGIKMPGFFRKSCRNHCLKKSKPDATLLWNRLEKYRLPGRLIYYEHGASWIEKKSLTWTDFLQNVDLILANSHAAKRLLQLKWDVKQPIKVIENPLKPQVLPALVPKKAKETLHIGYIGRLIPLKGVSLILHAVKLLGDKNVVLSIAGEGPEKEALIKEALRLGIKCNFLGAIQDVSAFYDAIDLLIVPSIREPLGLVAQEAALRACPAIGASVDGLSEVVLDQKTGFTISPTLALDQYKAFGGASYGLPDLVYNPATDSLEYPRLVDPNQIASKIRLCRENPNLFEAMSRSALEFAKTRPNFIEYTQNLLQSIDFDTHFLFQNNLNA